MRVFIGLREVAGYFGNLKKGFDENKIDCDFLNLGGSKLNYSSGENSKWVTFFNKIGDYLGAKFSKNFILRLLWLSVIQNVFSLFAFFIAIFRYDVFIMGSNSTFFFFLELPILKLFRKKVIYVFLGTDSRPLYLNGYVYKGGKNLRTVMFLTKIQKIIIKRIEKYATFVINHPPQAYFHEKEFISLLQIGIPHSYKNNEVKKIKSEIIRIIHIPSKAGPKGSDQINEMILRLKEKHEIDYFTISGISHDEVLKIIDSADFAIDECYSDTPMAVFATECAFRRVPVVIGSYYSETIDNDYDKKDFPPSMFVLPEDMEKAIEKLIIDKDFREKLGKEAFDYVSSNWTPKLVAEKYMQIVEGNFPKEWYYNPNDIKYLYGCGLSKNQLQNNIRLFVEKGGIKSLCLTDKGNLENEYLTMLNNN